ncbi:MAG TPA: DUF3500 domain-containing protein [Candidatus Lustribacter sp.]|jgi:hypothetical protein|nr:DUF3500 domain-containing protein [Candidatus Lustribacter sp.]
MAELVRVQAGSARAYTPLEAFPEPVQTIFRAAEARADTNLAQPFKGITADGTIVPDLFPLNRTGVSLAPVAAAARSFLASLNDQERKTASFELQNEWWRKWHNMHVFFFRHGVCLYDLNDTQRAAALEVVRSALSAAGFENARDVMKLNEHIAELTGRREEFGEWYYYLSIFGEPSETEPWGWQIDGHHLIINCFILGDQLVLTPYFSGSEPVEAKSGKYAGTRVFEREESTGLALMKALSPAQQDRARIGAAPPRDVLTNAQLDNLELPPAGICWADLTPPQRELFGAILDVYVGRIRPGHDAVRMEDVRAHLAETYFAWMGPCDDTSAFYYRIQSPVVLIEFDHLPGVAYDNLEPTRAHVHTIVRTPNGNDYGSDLLRQHYAQHDHSHPDTPHRRGSPAT